jgi:prepilin-type N-terminal cleavage/methylation domain-containing protein
VDFSHLHRTRRVAHSRGFTLIELMVVVVIIAILAAIAVPQIVERLRERRAGQAAQEIALLYRNARLRAMGQGFAVLVNYTPATGFQVREAMPFNGINGTCTLQLPFTCTSNPWAVAGTDYRVVGGFDPTTYPDETETLTLADGSTPSWLDMCFTARGRTYSRTANSAALLPITGMVNVAVKRTSTGNTRNVSVLPNGMARLSL